MEQAAKIAGQIVGGFMFGFIVTWIGSRLVRWIGFKAAPQNRRIAFTCAVIAMLLVVIFVWKSPFDTDGIIHDATLLAAATLNFLFDLAWLKYPPEKTVATPPVAPDA